VAGIVDEHVEAAALGDDPGDRGLDRGVAGDVELDGAQVDAVARRRIRPSRRPGPALRPAVSRIEA
jgi:hypothetical protein